VPPVDAPLITPPGNAQPRMIVVDPLAVVSLIPLASPDFVPHRLLMFEAVLATQAKRVLETGTDVGDSARIFATALRRTGGVLFTVDRKTDLNLSWVQDYSNVMPIQGDSLKVTWNQTLDVLFLDSDHTKEHLLGELRKLGPWVRQGGLILVHDTVHSEFGPALTDAVRVWCREVGFRWSEDPLPHGMAIIEVIRDLTPLRA